MRLLYLTANQPGIGGQLKAKPEDFVVEEIPLYLPAGEGQHIYVKIEKRGLSTYAAINQLARALNISRRAIGHAGLKDAQAVTRQTLSIDGSSPEAIEALDFPNIKILSFNRHHNKLKIGHLAGNRFIIRVRQVTEAVLPIAQTVLATLQETGVPNFFGLQRFGKRNNTHRLGETLLRKDRAGFVAEYLGQPQPEEASHVQTARGLVDESRWVEALEKWPRNLSDERRVLKAIVLADGDFTKVFKALSNKKLKSFFVSAYQSYLFNQLLAQRFDIFEPVEALNRLEKGDVAYIHGKGASFVVEAVAVEQARAEQFEISPSGPLFGLKTLLAQHEPGQREQAILAEQGLTLEDFRVPGLKIRGARRPYRFKLKESRVWWDEGLMVSFALPPGAYATRIMAEIMKIE